MEKRREEGINQSLLLWKVSRIGLLTSWSKFLLFRC